MKRDDAIDLVSRFRKATFELALDNSDRQAHEEMIDAQMLLVKALSREVPSAPAADAAQIDRIGYSSCSSDDLEHAMNLLDAVRSAETNGNALTAVLDYRKRNRVSAAQEAMALPVNVPEQSDPPDTGHPLLSKLFTTIAVVDGVICWDYMTMYDIRDALNAAIPPAATADTAELREIARLLTLATNEGDDASQGTHYTDKQGRIRCKGSFLELIERARVATKGATP